MDSSQDTSRSSQDLEDSQRQRNAAAHREARQNPEVRQAYTPRLEGFIISHIIL